MTDDYGRRIAKALEAVRQMYADTSRLLQDCDGTVGKGKALATVSNNATRDISYSLGRPWLAKIAYRCYAADPAGDPGLVDVVSAVFFGEQVQVEEPVLLVGQVRYALDGNQLSNVCDGFHLCTLFFHRLPEHPLGEVLTGGPAPLDKGTAGWFTVIGVPLYSVRSMQDVSALMDRLGSPGTSG